MFQKIVVSLSNTEQTGKKQVPHVLLNPIFFSQIFCQICLVFRQTMSSACAQYKKKHKKTQKILCKYCVNHVNHGCVRKYHGNKLFQLLKGRKSKLLSEIVDLHNLWQLEICCKSRVLIKFIKFIKFNKIYAGFFPRQIIIFFRIDKKQLFATLLQTFGY